MSDYKNNNARSILSFNSVDRVKGEVSSPTFRLDTPLTATGKLAVISAIIPNTVFNIVTGNNALLWDDVSIAHSFTIPPGNYSATDLAFEMEN